MKKNAGVFGLFVFLLMLVAVMFVQDTYGTTATLLLLIVLGIILLSLACLGAFVSEKIDEMLKDAVLVSPDTERDAPHKPAGQAREDKGEVIL